MTDDLVEKVVEAVIKAHVLREAAAKIRHDCNMCDDGVFAVHHTPDGPQPDECEYCGRPIAAILALAEPEKNDDATG